jgi:hypothetical protein
VLVGTGATLTLTDAVVRGTLAGEDGVAGQGLAANQAGRLEATRVLVTENAEAGAIVSGAETTLVITDSAVTATHTVVDGMYGRGVTVAGGAHLVATRVLVADQHEFGVMVLGADADARLTDVVVSAVAPSARGFGLGAMALAGGRLEVERLAVVAVHGAGMAATATELVTGRVDGTLIAGTDVFVRDVRSSTIRFDETHSTYVPTGRRVAYGLHVGDGAALDLRRVVVAQGGFGFFAAAGGALAMHTGVITAQLDAAGAVNETGVTDAVVLDGVALYGNANDALVHGADLPQVAALEVPSAACVDLNCL